MKKSLKWSLIIIFSLGGAIALGYGAKRFYDFLIEDATRKIKKGLSDSINPLKLPGKIFGSNKH